MAKREPYHVLDPLWARVPVPHGRRFTRERVGPVTVLRMARTWFGRELMPVYCYAVGDTLVDTGVASHGDDVAAAARDAGVRRALVTHHHEDHAGNAARLQGEGVRVLASRPTAAIVAGDVPIRFYQHLMWGKAPPFRAEVLGDAAALGPYEARVVPAPGHCPDQVVFHVPAEGWLFSGDAFLSEHVKVFRRDEDFAQTVATLERLVALDFDALFCAHRPRRTGGRAALAAKLERLREVEGRVRALHAQGLDERAIAARLDGPRAGAWFYRLTAGDVSVRNLVRSILRGPEERREVLARI
jgi:glyoxylase-like metal-dependent hydrolase (beta-lactamase superfamily II)